jgi:hypothetical protein
LFLSLAVFEDSFARLGSRVVISADACSPRH